MIYKKKVKEIVKENTEEKCIDVKDQREEKEFVKEKEEEEYIDEQDHWVNV
jgi:hypothetical protein